MNKLVLMIIAGISILFSPCRGGDQFPVQSPRGDYAVESRPDKQTGLFTLWIVSTDTKAEKVLYQYSRDVRLVISPNGEYIAINTHYSSTDSDVLIFKKKSGVIFEMISGLRMAELVNVFYEKATHKVFPYDHWYVDCLDWSNDSKVMLLKAYGTGDEERLNGWYCAFDLGTRSLSFSLSEMNK